MLFDIVWLSSSGHLLGFDSWKLYRPLATVGIGTPSKIHKNNAIHQKYLESQLREYPFQ